MLKNSVEADKEAQAVARLAVGDLGLERLGIIYLKNDWGELHHQAFVNQVAELDAEVVIAESFTFGTKDFRSQHWGLIL